MDPKDKIKAALLRSLARAGMQGNASAAKEALRRLEEETPSAAAAPSPMQRARPVAEGVAALRAQLGAVEPAADTVDMGTVDWWKRHLRRLDAALESALEHAPHQSASLAARVAEARCKLDELRAVQAPEADVVPDLAELRARLERLGKLG